MRSFKRQKTQTTKAIIKSYFSTSLRPNNICNSHSKPPKFVLIINQLEKLKQYVMPKYLIEREIPGAGKLSQEELKAISQTSCSVLNKMGPQIQWVNSYVTPDKIYCVYIAPNEEMVREHASQGGFPANT